ncbi:MAG: hypothetical protein EAZ89_04505 [Bacteroidetes bacterium]|nr:MAG: hypothetical protein EAZ89_04505 [Bacteroidota bacterium]
MKFLLRLPLLLLCFLSLHTRAQNPFFLDFSSSYHSVEEVLSRWEQTAFIDRTPGSQIVVQAYGAEYTYDFFCGKLYRIRMRKVYIVPRQGSEGYRQVLGFLQAISNEPLFSKRASRVHTYITARKNNVYKLAYRKTLGFSELSLTAHYIPETPLWEWDTWDFLVMQDK